MGSPSIVTFNFRRASRDPVRSMVATWCNPVLLGAPRPPGVDCCQMRFEGREELPWQLRLFHTCGTFVHTTLWSD